MLTRERKTDAATVTLGIAAAAVAMICCAGLPTVGALPSGLTLATILGLGAASLLFGVLTFTAIAIFVRRRRHRRCAESERQS
jgi:hypothetical protein